MPRSVLAHLRGISNNGHDEDWSRATRVTAGRPTLPDLPKEKQSPASFSVGDQIRWLFVFLYTSIVCNIAWPVSRTIMQYCIDDRLPLHHELFAVYRLLHP